MFSFEALAEGDLPFLLEVRNECRDMLHDDREFGLEQCANWFRVAKPDFHMIRLGGERIGYFRLSNHDQAEHSIYIGADLHAQFRGRRLARPAYEEFFPIVRDRYGVDKVKLEVLSHNVVACRLYETLGFLEVERRKAFAVRGGVPVDSIVMSRKV